MYRPPYLSYAPFGFFSDSYHFDLYHSLLRIVHILRSRVILVVLMRLAYVSQNNKQIYFSFPLDVSFLTFFSISLSLFVSLFSYRR